MQVARAYVLCSLTIVGVACVGDTPQQPLINDAAQPEAGSPEAGSDTSVDALDASAPVTGKVLDRSGQPIASASVRVGSVNGPTQTTDANGNFTVVAPPTYDLSVAAPGAQHNVTTYVGLTRRDPRIVIVNVSPTSSTVSLSGSFSGAVAQGQSGPTYALSANGAVSWGYATVGVGTYSANMAAYFGPGNTTGIVYVLEANSTLGEGPYHFGVSNSAGLTNTGSFTNINLMSSTPTEAAVLGTITTAGGGALSGLRKQITVSPGVGWEFAYDPAAMSFNTKFPAINGATFGVNARLTGVPGTSNAAFVFASNIKPNDPALKLALPLPPVQTVPADKAVSVDRNATQLTWTGSGVSVVTLVCSGSPGEGFRVITSGHQLTLPDAPDLGVTVPAGASCDWTITSLTGFVDTDDAAKDGIVVGWPSLNLALLARSGAELDGPQLTFTLK